MPELPEVETFSRYFAKTSLNQQIEEITVNDERILENDKKKFKKVLIGNTFKKTIRHGKNLFVEVNDGTIVLFHFGMTGDFHYYKDPSEEPDHSRIVFKFKSGYMLSYISQRLFGKVQILEDIEEHLKKKGLGPDALNMTFKQFQKALNRRSAYLKSLLLDQSFVAGIGNIYSDEILFQSGLHLKTHVNILNDDQLRTLFDNIKKVLNYGIAKKGILSEYSKECLIPHRDKEGICPICGENIQRIKIASRHGFFCPKCQPKITESD
ncbi:MAG: Fpg/Nei family DNA glycosylase [Promethearchaeia archaeon]